MPEPNKQSVPLFSEPIVIVNKNPTSPMLAVITALKLPLLFIIVLIIGVTAGFYLEKRLQKDLPSSPVPSQATHIKQLLEHPALSNWSAKVRGEVVEKTDTFFTLTPTNNQSATASATMKITYLPNQTVFENISYDNLPTGTVIIGDVKFRQTKDRWEAVGESFQVVPTMKNQPK